MSAATKKRFVMRQVETELLLPKKNEIVARVLQCRGNNLHEVEDANGEIYLASMPTKFRNAVWIRRGTFVFLISIEEGVKVKAEITHILDAENVLYVREHNLWPERFDEYAQGMTREAKRGTSDSNKKHGFIDEDMLPPSDSDVEEDEECEATDDDDVGDDDDDVEPDEKYVENAGGSEEAHESNDEETHESNEESDDSESESFKICNPNRLKRL